MPILIVIRGPSDNTSPSGLAGKRCYPGFPVECGYANVIEERCDANRFTGEVGVCRMMHDKGETVGWSSLRSGIIGRNLQ